MGSIGRSPEEWTVAILFIGGYFVCILGFPLLTAASFLGAILSYLVRYIAVIVKLMAKLPFAALYTRNGYALLWLILVYLVFALTYFARDKSKKYSPVLPAALSVVSLVSVFFWTDLSMRRDGGTANILDVGSGQCIVLTQGEHAAVIDCGSKGTTQQAGSEASYLLHSLGRTKIDVLLLTHIHSDHADGAARLLNRVKVKTLLLPANAAENADEALLREILHAAKQNGTEILYIDCDTRLSAGDIGLNIYAPFPKGDKNERGLMLSAKVGGRTMLITGDVSTTTEQKLVLSQPLEDTDILLVGHHGSKYSTCEALLQEAAPEISVISVGYNSYGHPTDEVLARLRDAGTQILRTDESGNIQIICGD